jgi:signal peptidase II
LKQKYLILFSLSGLIICLDQLTKLWVRANVPEGSQTPWLSWVWLTHHRNKGFALNFIQNLPPAIQNLFFIAVPAFALFLIILIFIKLRDNQMLTSLALTSILGGAVGNMIDRFEVGPVLDVLELRAGSSASAPFNVADIAIVVGVGIVFINTVIQQRAEKKS